MKPILFVDFDATLCHDKFWRNIDADNFGRIQNFLFGEDTTLINEWMRGKHSSENINQLVSQALSIPFEKLWQIFVEDCRTMSVSRTTLDRIKRLSERYRTVLMTDNMDCFTRFTVPALKLDKYFDTIICSSENESLKEQNEGEIFVTTAQACATTVENSVLIDNSKTACNLFSAFGGTSYHVTTDVPVDNWLDSLEKTL